MQTILKYFPQLSDEQQRQFAALDALYHEWNEKINVISRKDIDNLYLHHVLHSLAIARMVNFRPGTRILDFGTGGGFPGIPLSILFPECQFRAIGLKNCQPEQLRGEEERGHYDFVVSRAVMPLPDLVRIVRKNIARESHNALPNGVLCLKGGQVQGETAPFRRIVEVQPLSNWFTEEWFREKYCIYLPL